MKKHKEAVERKDERVPLTVTMPRSLREGFDKLAVKEKRSLTFLVNEAAEQYLASKAA